MKMYMEFNVTRKRICLYFLVQEQAENDAFDVLAGYGPTCGL